MTQNENKLIRHVKKKVVSFSKCRASNLNNFQNIEQPLELFTDSEYRTVIVLHTNFPNVNIFWVNAKVKLVSHTSFAMRQMLDKPSCRGYL